MSRQTIHWLIAAGVAFMLMVFAMDTLLPQGKTNQRLNEMEKRIESIERDLWGTHPKGGE